MSLIEVKIFNRFFNRSCFIDALKECINRKFHIEILISFRESLTL